MYMKNKKLLVSALLGVSTLAIGAVVGVAAGKKSGLRAYANPVEGDWHHYSAQAPVLDGHGKATNKGTKEYWVQCGGAYQFTEPASGNKVNMDVAPDTSEFAANDDRWATYCEVNGHSFDSFGVCEHCNELENKVKVADKAIASASALAEEAPLGFSDVFTATGLSSNTALGSSFSVQNYDVLYFSLYHDIGNMFVFGGGSDNPIMWKADWYNFLLVRDGEGGKFLAHYKKAYETAWNVDRFKVDGANDQNFSSILRFVNWSDLGSANVKCTEVYTTTSNMLRPVDASKVNDASIKEIFLTKQVRRVEQQDEWKSPIGSASNETGHAEYYQIGSKDFIHFSAHYAVDDPEYTYNNNWSEWRFAHSKVGLGSVTFDYIYTDTNSETGNDGTGMVHTMCQWYNGSTYYARSMALNPDGKFHTITVTGDYVDAAFFVMKIYHFTGDIYISNIRYGVGEPVAATEDQITDASIKELQTSKQVRRVEQQDEWKSPIGSASNETGHSEYFKIAGRDTIHFSAHYAVDDPEYTYNNNWSEWRFTHHTDGLTSVTLTYLYEDSNSDLANDGTDNNVHTMSQWYDGTTYKARNMDLIPDGEWHTVVVSGEAFDTEFFVMKIYHFTGDIYISNIVYA